MVNARQARPHGVGTHAKAIGVLRGRLWSRSGPWQRGVVAQLVPVALRRQLLRLRLLRLHRGSNGLPDGLVAPDGGCGDDGAVKGCEEAIAVGRASRLGGGRGGRGERGGGGG
jgi:hypothetical protein